MKRTNWGAILIAYGVGVAGAVQVGRVAPAAGSLANALGFDLATLGWAVSLITLASALLGLGAGHLVLRRGARAILLSGTAILAAGVLLASFAPSAQMLLAIRAVEGIGYLAIVVAAPTLIARAVLPADAPAALALWGTFFTAGLSLAALAGGWLSEAYGWRVWFGLNAGLLALAWATALWALPKDPAPARLPRESLGDTRLPTAAWLMGAAFFGVTLLSLALLSMLPPFLVDVRGFSPAAAGGTTGLVALASIGGSLAYGSLASRLGQQPIVLAAVLLLITSGFPAFHAGLSPNAGIAFAALAVAGTGVLVAHVFASVPRLVTDPEKIGPANGLIAQIGSIGALTGPPVVGYLVSASGWSALSVLVALFSATFLMLMAAAERAARGAATA